MNLTWLYVLGIYALGRNIESARIIRGLEIERGGRPDASARFSVPSTMQAWALDGTATSRTSTRSLGSH